MKNFLLFNDFSSEAEHAAELALLLAGKTNVNLYVWNTIEYTTVPMVELAVAGTNEGTMELKPDKNSWIEKLESRLNWETGLRPTVHFIEGVDYLTDNVLSVTKKYDIGMLIRGTNGDEGFSGYIEASILRSATKSGCPVLVIPHDFPYKAFEKIVYATDLRFCRNEVVAFLTQMAKELDSSVLVANISEKGLPLMAESYADAVFEDAVVNRNNSDCIYFSNVKERNVPKALDILVNGMNNDLLVLVNNKFHFNELVGHESPYAIPENIRVPLLIFPS
ncbi:MAG: universal stress protein [Mucilaginibacter sp.]